MWDKAGSAYRRITSAPPGPEPANGLMPSLTCLHLLFNQLTQLMHCHGIQMAAVITGNDVKVLQAEPVLFTVLAIQLPDNSLGIRGQVTARLIATLLPSRHSHARWTAALQRGRAAPAFRPHPADSRLTALPAVLLEIISLAADGIGGVAPDIGKTVTIKIHRIRAITGRHELSVTHGSGVGAFEL